jgi:hypothetical protein
MDGAQLVVSLVSGGLAGGGVSALSNRIFHWRSLRTKFEPILNNFFAAYVIRMEDPVGRYWEGEVGYVPKSDDEEFVYLRSGFIAELIQFNELKEARDLRLSLIRNPNVEGGGKIGDHYKVDLMPEYEAVSRCLDIVHKKLKLG